MKVSLLIGAILSASILVSFTSDKKPSAKRAMKTLKGFCIFVPGGDAVIEGDTLSVQGFHMSQEITNFQYQEFLFDLKKKNETEKLKKAQYDSTLWNSAFGWENNGYKDYYHSHPAYHKYPVVNITKEGAELYCEWLTEKYMELSGGELNLKFRIPTHAEWIRAVRDDNHDYAYAWGGPTLRNAEGVHLVNCVQIGTQNITRNKETGAAELVSMEKRTYDLVGFDNSDVTAPSVSYYPNNLGFYNMNGNVSEMISDGDKAVGGDWRSYGYDIRNESVKDFTGAHPTVGFRVVATHAHKEN